MVYIILVILFILPLDVYSQSEKNIFNDNGINGVYLGMWCNPDCDTYISHIGGYNTEINPTLSDFDKRYSGLYIIIEKDYSDWVWDIKDMSLRVYQDVLFLDSNIEHFFSYSEDINIDITPGYIDYNGEIQYNKYWCQLPLKYVRNKTEGSYLYYFVNDKYYDKYGNSSNKKNKLPGRLVGYHKNTFKHHPKVFTIVEIIKDGEVIYRGGFLLNKNGYNG